MTEPITTELRGVMSHTTMAGIPLVELGEYEFASRCDAIDAVHANLERENESLRRELDRTRGEWDYWESTHVELPKDADGVPIRVGDVMENLREDLEPSLHHRFTVYGIHYRAYGQECALTEDGYPSKLYRASETRHHHESTVEDVLREFGDWCAHTKGGCDEDGIIAEYANRLRLAGDAE